MQHGEITKAQYEALFDSRNTIKKLISEEQYVFLNASTEELKRPISARSSYGRRFESHKFTVEKRNIKCICC